MVLEQAMEFQMLTRDLQEKMADLQEGVREIRRYLKKDRFIPDEAAAQVQEDLGAVRDMQRVLRERFREWDLGKLEGSIEEARALVEEVFDRRAKLAASAEIRSFILRLSAQEGKVEEYLQELREDIRRLEPEEMDLAELGERLRPFGLLKDAFLEQDPGTKFALVKDLFAYFPGELVLALSMGLLSLQEPEEVPEEAAAEPSVAAKEDTALPEEAGGEGEGEEPRDLKEAEEEEEETAPFGEQSPEGEAEPIEGEGKEAPAFSGDASEEEEVPEAEAEEAEASAEADAEPAPSSAWQEKDEESPFDGVEETIPVFEDGTEYTVEMGESKDQNFSVKLFRRDIVKHGLTYLLTVIHDIGAVTVPFLKEHLKEVPVPSDENSLEKMLSKGYLLRFATEGYEPLYTLSTKGQKVFENKGLCESFLPPHYRLHKSFPFPVSYAELMARHLLLLPNLFWGRYVYQRFPMMKIPPFREVPHGYYWRISGSRLKANFAGAAAQSPKEYLEFLLYLSTLTLETKLFFVSGVTEEHARALALAIGKIFSLEKSDVWYSFLGDGEFYSLESEEMLDGFRVEEVLCAPQDADDAEAGEEEAPQAEPAGEEVSSGEPQAPAEPKSAPEGKAEAKPALAPVPAPAPEEKPSLDGQMVRDLCREMLILEKPCCALAALAAASRMDSRFSEEYLQLAYALDDPMVLCDYGAQRVISVYYGGETQADYLAVSASLRTFFSDHYRYDHFLQQLHSIVSRSPVVESYSALGNLLFDLFRFKNENYLGMDCFAPYRQREKRQLEEAVAQLRRDARDHYESLYQTFKSDKSSNKRYMEMRRILFAQDGDLGRFLKAVSEDNRGELEAMEAFLKTSYIRDGAQVQVASLDGGKLDLVLDDAWNQTQKRGTVTFIGDLRNRTANQLRKVASILAEYVDLCRQMDASAGDRDGSLVFAQMRQGVEDSLKECLGHFGLLTKEGTKEEQAGRRVLILTLQELLDKMEGTYSELGHKYFYLDFLKTEEVLLGEDYFPILEEVPDLPELGILSRIRRHVEAKPQTLPERFESIVMGQDDYGEAMLIARYYESLGGQIPDIIQAHSLKEEAVGYPLAGIRERCQEFKEDIKLAQSNGLFDVAGVERMESILQNMEIWYEKAEETMNYGFFRKILAAYGRQIREESKIRATQLEESLQRYIEDNPSEAGSELLTEIHRRIEDQNYVAAEDLLNRVLSGDLEEEGLRTEEDYLALFLDKEEYSQNIRKTADAELKLSQLLGSATSRNKDFQGGQRILENWISTGMEEEKVKALLGALGFRVDSVDKNAPIGGSIVNYLVLLQRPVNGRRQNYKHPIAAFGSEAEEKSFRVVCLFERMNADRLIDIFKEIGNAKHTLVLLDDALTLPDRRELARRTKTELSSRIFAVVDRVVIAFLVRHSTEQSVNRMLMHLIMPFASYQPYVVDSANVMPQEIFIGRKAELEKIESPKGVNIVYGGRQLGKSALLRMAQKDIDHDENGDRAILVDIKDKDYKSAALAISEELYVSGIFTEEKQITSDWNALSRELKRRLRDKRLPDIPYLLLMMDEADVFIESCASVGYMPFDALKDVQSIGTDRFKFVVAGLRNIVRFNKSKALGGNSGLAHLGDLTVKPFKSIEARQLLLEPLSYLGFRFPHNRETEVLISTILSTTNYFPGMIQLYCSKLIETMQRGYAGFSEKETPPYVVGQEQIKKVLNDEKLLEAISDKFFVTLSDKDDNVYYIIALLVAYDYHLRKGRRGCTPAEILSYGHEFSLRKLETFSEDVMRALMEELRELNILKLEGDSRYFFTRLNFCQSLGTMNQIEDVLMELMEE